MHYVQSRRFNVNHLKHCFLSRLGFFDTKRSRCEQEPNLRGKIPDPIGFRVQRFNHSAITSDAIRLSALCSTSSFQWNHLTHGFLSKAGSLSLTQIRSRCEQDSNLRGKIPLDFESNALTTRPSHRLSALCSTSSFQCEPLDAWLPFQSWISFFKTN